MDHFLRKKESEVRPLTGQGASNDIEMVALPTTPLTGLTASKQGGFSWGHFMISSTAFARIQLLTSVLPSFFPPPTPAHTLSRLLSRNPRGRVASTPGCLRESAVILRFLPRRPPSTFFYQLSFPPPCYVACSSGYQRK